MSAQLNYSYQLPPGVPGGLFDLAPHSITSRANGETAWDTMQFGLAVCQGNTPGKNVVLPTAASTAETFEGVTNNGFTTEHDLRGRVHVAPKATIGVLRWGKVWVRLADGVTVAYGDPVVAATDGTGTFTNVAADGFAIAATFIGAGADGIAPIELFNQQNT